MSNIDMNKNSENGSSNYTGDDKFVIKNLNLHYGDFHALKNINMNIPKNQITAFIGPSGCGMVFQQPNPFPKSIYDNIAYGPRLFGVHKKA